MNAMLKFLITGIPEGILIALMIRGILGRKNYIDKWNVIAAGVTVAITLEVINMITQNPTMSVLPQIIMSVLIFWAIYRLQFIESLVTNFIVYAVLIVLQVIGGLISGFLINFELARISGIEAISAVGMEFLLGMPLLSFLESKNWHLNFQQKKTRRKIFHQNLNLIVLQIILFVIMVAMNYSLISSYNIAIVKEMLVFNLIVTVCCIIISIYTTIKTVDIITRRKFDYLLLSLRNYDDLKSALKAMKEIENKS